MYTESIEYVHRKVKKYPRGKNLNVFSSEGRRLHSFLINVVSEQEGLTIVQVLEGL